MSPCHRIALFLLRAMSRESYSNPTPRNKRAYPYRPLLINKMMSILNSSSSMLFLLLSLSTFLSRSVTGFVVLPSGVSVTQQQNAPLASSTLLRDTEEDSFGSATPLTLTSSDLARLTELKSRHYTIPILIMDSMLPGQSISFERYEKRALLAF